MATKTFDELKQLAIQIRDEKTNKQNTATRVGTEMLEHLNKLEQDYYDKTKTDEELKKRDNKLTELELKNRNICFYSYNSVSPYIFKSPFKSIRFVGVDTSKKYYLRQFQFNYSSIGVFIQIYSEDGTKTYNFTKNKSDSTRVGNIVIDGASVFYELYDDVEDGYTFFNGENSTYNNIFSTNVFIDTEKINNIENSITGINQTITNVDEKTKENSSNINLISEKLYGVESTSDVVITIDDSSENGYPTNNSEYAGDIYSSDYFKYKKIDLYNVSKLVINNANLGTSYYTYAFYSSNEPGRDTFISGNDTGSSSSISEKEIEIPESAKCCVFCQNANDYTLFKASVTLINEGEGDIENLKKDVENLNKKIEEVNTKPLAGKEVLMFGDSFIDYGIYPTAIENILGCTVINRGVGGSTICRRDDKPNQSLICRLFEEEGAITIENGSALPDSCDLVIINAGVNDFIQWKELGTIDLGLSDDTKIYSAIQIILYNLIEKYPGVPIVWGTPCHFKSNTTEYKDLYYDENNMLVQVKYSCTLGQIRNAIIECCGLFGVKVADFYAESNIYPLIESNNTLYTNDGLHPSVAGANKLAEIIKKCL